MRFTRLPAVILVLSILLLPSPSSIAQAPAKMTPLQMFNEVNENRFLPSEKDLTVPRTATGFGMQWVGAPWYKVMAWCAAETAMAATKENKEQVDRVVAVFEEDAESRYKADHGDTAQNAKDIRGSISALAIMFSVPGLPNDKIGRDLNLFTCNGMHQGYVAFTSKPAAPAGTVTRPAAAAAATIPYLDGGALSPDAKDKLISAAPGPGLQKWVGHPWYQPMVWCEALTLAAYQRSEHKDPDAVKILMLSYLGPAKERLAKDRDISPDMAGKFVGLEVDRIGKQMYLEQFPDSPPGTDAQRSCTDMQKTYMAQLAGK